MNWENHFLKGLVRLCFIVNCASCSSNKNSSLETETDACINAATDADGNLILSLNNSMNYHFKSSLAIQSVDISAQTNIRFDWSGLTVDMLGQPIDPLSGIDIVEVVLFSMTKEEILKGMNDDNLPQSGIRAPAQVRTHQAVSSVDYLSLLSVNGAPIEEDTLLSYLDPDTYNPENYTFAVILAQGNTLGKGARMIQFFKPVNGELNQEVALTDDSTILSYEADISSAKTISLPEGRADIVLEWLDELTVNGFGREFIPTKITEVMVARYSDATPNDLEEQFLDIEYMADNLYRADIASGAAVQLSDLVDENGAPFKGISSTGTWIVALFCGDCANPAPWFLSVIKAC